MTYYSKPVLPSLRTSAAALTLRVSTGMHSDRESYARRGMDALSHKTMGGVRWCRTALGWPTGTGMQTVLTPAHLEFYLDSCRCTQFPQLLVLQLSQTHRLHQLPLEAKQGAELLGVVAHCTRYLHSDTCGRVPETMMPSPGCDEDGVWTLLIAKALVMQTIAVVAHGADERTMMYTTPSALLST